MTHCRRCHRAIVNAKSVMHGFGPVCWRKLQMQDYDERPTMFRITITDKAEATKSLTKVRELLAKSEVQNCRFCGELLRPENIEYYDHEGGFFLPGFGQPQWLYHHCDKCRHDLSLWKLRIPEFSKIPAPKEKENDDVICLDNCDPDNLFARQYRKQEAL